VAVDVLDYSKGGYGGAPRPKDSGSATPLVLSTNELKCLKEYLPLPGTLDLRMQFGSLDLSEEYYTLSSGFFSHEIRLTATKS
jgi:hypothetical protein